MRYYHGTSVERADSIMTTGLRPASGIGAATASTMRTQAEQYGQAVISFDLPDDNRYGYSAPDIDDYAVSLFVVTRKVPTYHLTRVK